MNDLILKQYIKDNIDAVTRACCDSHRSFIDAGTYFITRFNALPSRISIDNILKDKLHDYLVKNEWLCIQKISSSKNKLDSNRDIALITSELGGAYASLWIKDKYLIHLTDNGEQLCDVIFSYCTENQQEAQSIEKDICGMEKQEDNGSHFYLLIKNNYGELEIKKHTAIIPENMDPILNYGKSFETINKDITHKLSQSHSGLYVLHGAPGTGKSTYIKWLSTKVKKKFIYVPEFMVASLNDPSVIQLFIEHSNSVIILEDAEKIIAERTESTNTMAPLILNLTDGILADIMKLSVIVTYNSSTDKVDKALLRKGRLKYLYEFGTLELDDVITLLKHQKMSKKQIDNAIKDGKVKDGMTLADIYNIFDENNSESDLKEPSSFGFNDK